MQLSLFNMPLRTSFKLLKLLRITFGSSVRRCPSSLSMSSSSSTSKKVTDMRERWSRDAVSYTCRTDTCGSLRKDDVGKIVKLCGWVLYQRVGFFVVLRDWEGITQLVIPKDKVELIALVSKLSKESVLEVTGKVISRPPGEENTEMTTGQIEVEVQDIKVLNPAINDLPFSIKKFDKVNETMRMGYRYLDIRTDKMQRNLRLRSKMIMKMREFLVNKHEFVDVETPTLFRRTPGGAKEFIVPCSQHPGKFYSLPQSPQQFKQLLMVGGIDRYFQIARCYRNEGAKPDRQPEFTQLDIEMSFVEQEGIIKLIEDMLVDCWPSEKPPIIKPFPHITYDSAMRLYGVDKPDTRFDMLLHDVTSHFNHCGVQEIENVLQDKHACVVAIKLMHDMNGFSKTWIQNSIKSAQEKLADKKTKVFVVQSTDDGHLQVGISKYMKADVMKDVSRDLDLRAGDFLVLAAGLHFKPHELLGKLRLQSAEHLESNGIPVRKQDSYNFLWVRDFPLFVPKEDGDGLESAHHPFTAVHPEDRHKFHVHPEQIDVSELQHLLEALSMGCPPHGGIALGLDRLFAIICGSPSIRDVIAFPKSHDGKDLMSKAPTSVPAADLDLYHISVKHTSS